VFVYEDGFIRQLKLQAIKTVECLEFLEKNMDSITLETVKEKKKLIDELIEIKSVLMDDLHNTFITPIDREDIYNISISLFEMAYFSLTTLEEMLMFDVKADEFIKVMVEKVKMEAEEIYKAIDRLKKNPRVSYDHLLKITKMETRIDRIYRDAVKILLQDKDVLANELQRILHTREVYRHLSNMSDHARIAANVLGIALIKLS
ncbi:MAG TPA: DUF47 family protein, partial [Chitinophagaceae bacterium]|nr:DUF47 family protein [Chitinophagaceae bacterium]